MRVDLVHRLVLVAVTSRRYRSRRSQSRRSRNAPCGARCFLTGEIVDHERRCHPEINAPFGARCFLTMEQLANDYRMALV